MVSSGTSFHCCGIQTEPSRGGRCRRREPGQVVLAPGERDRLRRAREHLVPLRVGPAVAGPGEQQVDPLGGRAEGVAAVRVDRRRDELLGLDPREGTAGLRGRVGRGPPGAADVGGPGGEPVPGELGDPLLAADQPGDRRRRRRGCGPPGRGAARAVTGWRSSATASRVRAWVKATVPASGSSTSPASRAGVRASSTSSTGSPATAASRSSEKRRPRTAARRSSSRVRSGRPCRRRTMTSRTVAGSVGAVPGVEPGELDEEVGVAARPPVPVRDHLGGYDGACHGVHQAPRLLRASVRPGRAGSRGGAPAPHPTSARSPVGSGSRPPGDEHRQAVPGRGARDEVSQHLEATRCRPSAGRRAPAGPARTTTGR